MVKVEVNIPQAKYEILKEVATKLGVPVLTLVQQAVDQDLTTMCEWLERVANPPKSI